MDNVERLKLYPHLVDELIAQVDDLLINEDCPCARTHRHPCPRCKVTIVQAQELLRRLWYRRG